MTTAQFLQQIQPNLTVITALFAFLILFVKLFWFFLGYEKTLREENLSRLQDLVNNEQDVQIVKPLQDELSKNIELGYNYAISLFYLKQFNPTTGTYEYKIVDDDDQIKLIVGKSPKDVINDLSGQGIAQKTGQDLFLYLEKRYQQTSVHVLKYNKTKSYCQKTWIYCIILAILCIVGIVIFIAADNQVGTLNTVVNFWTFSILLVFAYGISSFVQLFYHRHRLIKDWEKLKIYGE